jgi:large subunit ribosomal protein L25
MNKKVLKAEERKVTGRKVKTLRAQGYLPGNISGKKVKSVSVQVNLKEFEAVYKEAGETGLVDLEMGKDVRPVLIHGLQVNPKTDLPVHVDFLQVDLKAKVTAQVPVELIGESPAEKQGIGTVVQQLNEIEVEALPADLPEKFEINVEDLAEVDQAIYVKDVKVDKTKVELKEDPEAIVAKVEPPQKEEVVEAPAPAEGEAAEGVPVAEGQTPAEGNGEEAPKEG